MGFTTQTLTAQTHDLVYASLISDPSRPTVLIYGHYDVQPAGAPSQWTTPAFTPSIRKGRIYARGASDNKGQLAIHIQAVKELQQKFAGQKLPINIKFAVEGEEEIGSPSIESLVSRYPDNFSCDYVFLSDTEMVSEDHPAIDISLRGVMDLEITLQTGSHDLHSGQFGGIAPNPAFILSDILSGLKSGSGRINIPGFYSNIVPLTAKETADFKRLEPLQSNLLKEGHFYYITKDDPRVSLNRRRWSEPTLDITGLDSGYTGHGTKTIIPNTATAKLSIRLVPNQDPLKIYSGLVKYLNRLIPKRCVYSVNYYPVVLPYKAPSIHPIYQLAKDCLRASFQNPAVFTGQGGSIGFVPALAAKLQVPCVLIGFGLPDDNVHAPNEFLSLSNYFKGISSLVQIYSQLPNLQKTINLTTNYYKSTIAQT